MAEGAFNHYDFVRSRHPNYQAAIALLSTASDQEWQDVQVRTSEGRTRRDSAQESPD